MERSRNVVVVTLEDLEGGVTAERVRTAEIRPLAITARETAAKDDPRSHQGWTEPLVA